MVRGRLLEKGVDKEAFCCTKAERERNERREDLDAHTVRNRTRALSRSSLPRTRTELADRLNAASSRCPKLEGRVARKSDAEKDLRLEHIPEER